MYFFKFVSKCHDFVRFGNYTINQEVVKVEIEINPEDLPIILERIGPNNINRIEVFGINEDGSREKIDLSEFISAQKKNLPSS